LAPSRRMEPPPWSLALDAHYCIMVGSRWPTEYKYASVIIRQWRAPLGIEAYDDRLISVGVFLS
jgi:hypothetical protein